NRMHDKTKGPADILRAREQTVLLGTKSDDLADAPLLRAERNHLNDCLRSFAAEGDLHAARGTNSMNALHHAPEGVFSGSWQDRDIKRPREQPSGAVGIPLRIDTNRTAIKSYFTILDHDRNDNRLANELVDEGGPRVVVDLLWRPGLLDAALVHHHHTVGDFERLLLVVRDKERRNVDFGVKISEPAPQILAYLGIE